MNIAAKRLMVLALLTALLLTCGCSHASKSPGESGTTSPAASDDAVTPSAELPARDATASELPMDYIKYEYNMNEEYYIYDEIYGVHRNITGTGGAYNTMPIQGSSIITFYDDYAKLMEVLQWQGEREDGMGLLRFDECYRSPALTLDEAFFDEHNLLVVDLLVTDALYLRSEIREVESAARKVTLELSYGPHLAATADNRGVLYLIALPKDCTNAEILWTPVGYDTLPATSSAPS